MWNPPFLQPCLFHLELGNENAVDRWDKACSWKLWWLAFEQVTEHEKLPKIGQGTYQQHVLLLLIPMLFWPQIGKQKLGWLVKRNMFLKPMMVSFWMRHWTSKVPKNWARNKPIHLIFLLHLPWLFWSWIGKWKPLQSPKQSRHLKGPIISFQENT